MPICPTCSKDVKEEPSKVYTVIAEPREGQQGLSEKKVGFFQCRSCNANFPAVIGRQKYLLLPHEQVKRMDADLKSLKKSNERLEAQLKEMNEANSSLRSNLESTRREAELRRLQTSVGSLQEEVNYLKRVKANLGEKLPHQLS